MTKKYYHIIPVAAMLIIMGSCTEEIDIELDSTFTRLVVNGKITTENTFHIVTLSTTTDYFFTESPPPVTGANVSISFDDISIDLLEDNLLAGTYSNPVPFAGIPGKTYTLSISGLDVNDDGEEDFYTAKATMPERLFLDSVAADRFISPFFTGYQIAYFGTDPPGVQYYSFKLIRNNKYITTRLSDYAVQTDDFFGGQEIAGFPVGILDDTNENEAVFPGDTVTLELNSISKAYYNFILEAQNEIFGNNPLFSGPPANVSSNVDNGAQGFFSAYTIERKSVIIE